MQAHLLTPTLLLLASCACEGAACPVILDDTGKAGDTSGGGTTDTTTADADVPSATAADESDRTGSGGAADFGTPPWSVELDYAPWTSQVFSCDWSSTKTCGPTSLAMAWAAVDPSRPLDEDLVNGIVDDLGQPWPCGELTGIDQLEDAATANGLQVDLYYFDAELLVDAIDAGHPVIAPVWTQDLATGDMDSVSRTGHFVEIVGVTSTSVIANDPGRGSAADGERHSYALSDFLDAWYANGRYIGLEVSAAETEHEVEADVTCSLEGTTLHVRGDITADVDMNKASVTVDSSSALWSDTFDDSTYAIDADIDVSDYADGAEHTAGIWVRLDGDSDGIKVADCDFTVDEGSDCPDDDGDGYPDDACGGTDCDDGDEDVHPGATEQCDGEDNDCDGTVDDGVTETDWYPDDDNDGFGDSSGGISDCSEPSGYVDNDEDCDDRDEDINPDAKEQCDGEDNDCDGKVDDGVTETDWYPDDDGDGFGDSSGGVSDCEEPSGYVDNDEDCDDRDEDVNPDSTESECDGTDYDCDGTVDDGIECYEAVETSSHPTGCGSDEYDILTIYDVTVDNSVSPPQATLEIRKCDGSALTTDHDCNIGVGSIGGPSRGSFFWSAGSKSETITINIWNTTSDWESDPEGAEKELFVSCDEGGHSDYRYGEDPAVFEKQAI